jgi:hypothetical protein
MSNLKSFAEQELNLLSATATDPNDRPIIEEFKDEIIALCKKFGNSGQSGGSAPYVAGALSSAIKKLLLFQPIAPVMGTDDEWTCVTEINDGTPLFQNKRCSAIFKDVNGVCTYNDAIIKRSENGSCWSGSCWVSKEDFLTGNRDLMIRSSQQIKSFPFEPKTFYIDVIEEEFAKDDWEMYVKDKSQLDAVWEYFVKPSTLS